MSNFKILGGRSPLFRRPCP